MQLMCDALAVMGSRHGLVWNPIKRNCSIVRFDYFDNQVEVELRAGIIVNDEEITLPLSSGGKDFDFYDQRTSPCTMELMGIHAASATRVTLSMATPFKPRDAGFSTIPVLGIKIDVSRLEGNFRWVAPTIEIDEITVFLEISGEKITLEPSSSGQDDLDLYFESLQRMENPSEHDTVTHTAGIESVCQLAQHDRIICTTGSLKGTRFEQQIHLKDGSVNCLQAYWCTYSDVGLEVLRMNCPFKYSERFNSLDAVAMWAEENGIDIWDNAAKVDGIIADNNCAPSLNQLLANTLHSWMVNTWWVKRDGKDWYSVWEGSCYFHSTVDVEYTQAPFYLTLWPELLAIELDFWPEFDKSGEQTLGEAGRETRFVSHDVGKGNCVNGQIYPHEMPVEETTNWIILSYVYWRRSGDDSLFHKHADRLIEYLAFVNACDTTGSGIPDKGVANTIDDASPAVQFGREQVYLAVKVLAAYQTGSEMLLALGRTDQADTYNTLANKVRARIEEDGWAEDHFVTLLDPSGEGVVDPWTGEALSVSEVPGWDSSHIYTVNGMALLDMAGCDLGINKERIVCDLEVATQRCLSEYGCSHSDFANNMLGDAEQLAGMAGASSNPGWVSMNMLRDIAAFYRGVDLRDLSERYWNWQTTTNTQGPYLFFETFKGNNLNWYPRGIAVWGYFDALGGLVVDKVTGRDETLHPFPQVRVPRLIDADWDNGAAIQL